MQPDVHQATSPFVSIITPTYNNAEFISECIESVRAQTYQNWEYVIVNNCSTDGTFAQLEQLAARGASGADGNRRSGEQ